MSDDSQPANVPALAIEALAGIAMPDGPRLRAVAVFAIALTAEETDGRAMGLDDAKVTRRCRALAAETAARVRTMRREA